MRQSQFSLKSTERLLWKLITAPEGVEKALKDYRETALPIRGDNRLSNVERLDIYANMYFFRIRDSLKEDFPAVLKLIGEDRFHNLITDYLLKYPPTHWSLRYAGQHLPKFLKRHPFIKKWPFLSDLAKMEWALLDSFDAADAQALTGADLSSVSRDHWGELQLQLVPSCRLLRFRWRVDKIRGQLLQGRKLSSVHPAKASLIIWRKDLKVFYRQPDPLEEKLLRLVLKKVTFGALCGVAAREVGVDAASLKVGSYLQKWLQEKLLAPPSFKK